MREGSPSGHPDGHAFKTEPKGLGRTDSRSGLRKWFEVVYVVVVNVPRVIDFFEPYA